jgi:ankyrin repeat protein
VRRRDIEGWLDAHRDLGEGAERCGEGNAALRAKAVDSAPRRQGSWKVDALNAAGLPASAAVAAALSRRVQRVLGARSAAAQGRGVGASGSESLLGHLVRDERVVRIQEVLRLLSGAGADLANRGAAPASAGGRCSASDVIYQVMCKMYVALSLPCASFPVLFGCAGCRMCSSWSCRCDVREVSGAFKRGAQDEMEDLAACLAWREKWAVVCVPGDVMGQDEMGHSPLHAAALAGNAGALQVLLRARCDPMMQDWRGWTALHIAAYQGETECAHVILSLLASRATSECAKGAQDSMAMGSPDSMQKLARIVDRMGRSALHVWSYAREKRRVGDDCEGRVGGEHPGASRAFKLLVRASSSSFSSVVDGGRTQLHMCAAGGGSTGQWSYLVATLEGADVCARETGSEGRTAVAVAAMTGNAAVVEAYVQRSMGPLTLTDARGRTLLDLVCSRSLNLDPTCLCDLWDSLRVLDRWPDCPSVGFVDLLHSLGRSGKTDAGGGHGRRREVDQVLGDESLLSVACRCGNVAVVKRLLDLNVSPDAALAHPREHIAGPHGATTGTPQLSQGRDRKFPLVEHQTPLAVACRSGQEEMLRLLVHRGRAETDILTSSKGLHESVRRALEEGAPARASWCQRFLWACGRETPLITCVRRGFFEGAHILVESGCGCDVGWVRDPFAAAASQQDSPAKALSALAVLMLLAPSRDASSASLTR